MVKCVIAIPVGGSKVVGVTVVVPVVGGSEVVEVGVLVVGTVVG